MKILKKMGEKMANLISYFSKITGQLLKIVVCTILISFFSPYLPTIVVPWGSATLQGEVNSSSASDLITKLEYERKYASFFKLKSIDLHINSGGGSVLAGHAIIDKIQSIQASGIKVKCYASFAASMAFTIMQYCDLRVATSNSILMQHMIHNGNGRENMQFDTIEDAVTIQFFDKLHSEYTAKRMGITYREYMKRYEFSRWYKEYQGCIDNVIDYVYVVKTNEVVNCLIYRNNYLNFKRLFEKEVNESAKSSK